MTSALNDQLLDQIFRSARTFNSWADGPARGDRGGGVPRLGDSSFVNRVDLAVDGGLSAV
ncbi:hypothetical protein ACFOFO_25700 [Undibacterium arcticum]|uniref:Uncharacterized protein n=1 Tax=Undibacterium arcticum TaxID=1762892 RepID=A0ABV7FAP8_9BURK